MYILVLESSTTSAKAMYYDTESGEYEVDARPYSLDYADDHTRFKPDKVFMQTVAVGRELVRGRDVDAVALCSAWHSVGLFNERLEPVTPMYQWTSSYGSEFSSARRADEAYTNNYYETTGCMVNAIYPFFKLLKLAGTHDMTHIRAMGQGSYNNFRMTGELAVTDCILSGSGLMDIRRLTYADDLLQEIGIDKSHLPPLCTYKEKFMLSDEAAKLLGIKAGVPVIPTCADGALNQTGSGALHGEIMTFSVGTSGAIRLNSHTPRLSDGRKTWCYRTPSSWLSGAATNGATNCIDWFKQLAFGNEVTYSDIEANIRELDNTPVFLPFVFGERCPGWRDETRGGFRNLCPQHTLYDMYLGIEEGILFNLLQCYKELTRGAHEPTHIRLSGGILNSKKWAQMCADIFGRTLEIDGCKHASLMGGVVLAKERLGLIGRIEDHTLPPAGYVMPRLEKKAQYEQKFERYMHFYEESIS